MIKFCSMCCRLTIDDLREMLISGKIEDDCIGECGSEFTAYVADDLITASSKEDFIKQVKDSE